MMVITKARTLDDYRQAQALIAEMGEWDVAQCDANGLPWQDVISTYYSDDAESLRAKCAAPGTGLYIARLGPAAVGCLRHGIAEETAELFNFYVRPAARGQGAGRLLLATALDAIRHAGFGKVNLVTIAFMTDAIALYRKFGFRDCDAFEPAPAGLEQATRYMEMILR